MQEVSSVEELVLFSAGSQCLFPNQSATTVTYSPEGCNKLFNPAQCQAEYTCAGTEVTSTCQCSNGVTMNCSATEIFINACRGKQRFIEQITPRGWYRIVNATYEGRLFCAIIQCMDVHTDTTRDEYIPLLHVCKG